MNTEISSFFNDVDGDRVYFAEDFAEFFIPFFTNGIFNNGCQVIADKNNMSVDVSVGRGFINGYRYYNKIVKNLIIENADGVLNRIDNIVIRLDLTNRNITAQVIKGTPADVPQAPALQRDSVIYDLRIARVSVPAGATSITQDMVTDTRLNPTDCGNVISPIETPNTENLFIQIQTAIDNYTKEAKIIVDNLKTDADSILDTTRTNIDSKLKEYDKNYNTKMENYETTFQKALTDYGLDFSSWFANIKSTLGSDVAGNLLNKINDVESKIPTKTSSLKNDSNFVEDADYVHTTNDYSDEEKKKVSDNVSNISKIADTLAKSGTTTLSVSSWQLNSSSLYEIDVKIEDMKENHFVEVTMDIANQEKCLATSEVNSYNGGFKIATGEKPEQDIDVTYTYYLTNLDLGGNE